MVITMPLLEGLDGVNKMSKSAGQLHRDRRKRRRDLRQDHVDLGRADVALLRAAELPAAGGIAGLKTAIEAGQNPRDVKFELAQEIVARFHGAAAAEQAQAKDFTARFAEKALPTDLPPTVAPGGPEGHADRESPEGRRARRQHVRSQPEDRRGGGEGRRGENLGSGPHVPGRRGPHLPDRIAPHCAIGAGSPACGRLKQGGAAAKPPGT